MEELKTYAIYCLRGNKYVKFPEEELVEVVSATESEMNELVEKASWRFAPFGDTCCEYRYEETTIPRYNRNNYIDDFKMNNGVHCSECDSFINGKCCVRPTGIEDMSACLVDGCCFFNEREE